ncbi:MAG TPA: ribonuclease H-like domain-containing protein [Pyrinomonadaceae bacterium]|nr:ribonuclease H-like domain-containing protein [Pyrinomonadaceae bacterium]
MRGNIPIPEIPHGEELWLMVAITSLREKRTQQGKRFCDATARNATGTLPLKIWGETLEVWKDIKPGLWGITGKLETFQERSQFVVAEYRPITIEQYREHQNAEPILPRAYTLDIETLTLPDFRERVGPQLERLLKLGNMRLEQQQRYLEDIAIEEERCYQLGSLSATSGRILSIAVHQGPIAGLDFGQVGQSESEHVFGIDEDGNEQDEKKSLLAFLQYMKSFDPDSDELVGHNLISFDLPFIFQRCLVHCISAKPLVDLREYNVRGVFDTMRHWWLGDRRARVSLDDIAWALGIQSSKTAEVEGSKVFDLYAQGRLAEIREYNLNDVRVTRKIYERMVGCFGR